MVLKSKSQKLSIQVIVLAYSMFGVIGLSSQMLLPSPILYAINSGLSVFAYSAIAVLSKRLSFRELFNVMMPLNILNAVSAYLNLGYFYLKHQSLFNQINEFGRVAIEAAKNNVTLSSDYLVENMGSDVLRFNTSIPIIEQVKTAIPDLSFIPDWVAYLLAVCIFIYMVLDLSFSIISNIFTIITIPIIYIAIVLIAFEFNLGYLYIYFIPKIWIPIAATVDSFLRIYILRALFFRFMKHHPLIKSYMEVQI